MDLGEELNVLSATSVVEAITSGVTSAEAVTRACITRIEAREPVVGAFEFFDAGHALEQAKALDEGPIRGPLHGVPIGIKDCFDTHDMPTGWGTNFYAGRRTGRDAAVVALMREAGAVILGKTVTSELVAFWPGKTRNPHNPAHTTGVSSMGSAAGVADCMMPVGLATQSGGSTIRPAAHCGVIGYKATHAELPTDGLMAMQPTCDTVGFMLRDLADAALMRRALLGSEPAAMRPNDAPPRIALVRTCHWEEAEPSTHDVIETIVDALRMAGAVVDEPSVPACFDELTDAHATIQRYEVAHWRAYEWQHHREGMSEPMQALMSHGRVTPFAHYNRAMRLGAEARAALEALFRSYDLVLTPSAAGEAVALGYPTGSSNFNRMWSLLQAPSVNLPVARGPQDLPMGIQLIGRLRDDDRFLADCAWVRSLTAVVS